MAVDAGSAENLPRHTASTDSSRPEHGALARSEYGLREPTGTAVDQADAGDTVSEAVHGTTAEQDGTEPEEEGEETLQRALPARGNNGVGYKARGLPKAENLPRHTPAPTILS